MDAALQEAIALYRAEPDAALRRQVLRDALLLVGELGKAAVAEESAEQEAPVSAMGLTGCMECIEVSCCLLACVGVRVSCSIWSMRCMCGYIQQSTKWAGCHHSANSLQVLSMWMVTVLLERTTADCPALLTKC